MLGRYLSDETDTETSSLMSWRNLSKYGKPVLAVTCALSVPTLSAPVEHLGVSLLGHGEILCDHRS